MSDKLDLNQILNFQRKKGIYHQEIFSSLKYHEGSRYF